MSFVKLNLATLAALTGEQIVSAAKAEFSAIDAVISKRLPYLGALRFFAKVREVSLADLIDSHGSATRKAFEDSKPYSDILVFFGTELIPSAAFDSIPRAKARDLVAKFPDLKKDTATLEKVQAYLSGPCKFRAGWLDHVLSLLPAPAPVTETPPAPAPMGETPPAPAPTGEAPPAPAPTGEAPPAPAPAPAESITAMPPPAPMSAIDLIAMVKARMREMSDAQREAARAMLARLVNEPDKLAERLAA